MKKERYTILGIQIDALDVEKLHSLIGKAIRENRRIVIANHNLHSIYLYHRDPKMRSLYAKAEAVHIDGMPLVYWGRILGYPLRREHRVTYVDWIRPLVSESVRHGWRIFYLGSRPGVAEEGAKKLSQEFPGLIIETHHGYFDTSGEDNERVVSYINAFRPHLLLVGMGMPKQEHWILDNLERLSANVILPAGACIDYVAGVIPTPPRWMGRLGLEWLYRLISEPRRLGKRYLVEPWGLVPRIISDFFNIKIRGIE